MRFLHPEPMWNNPKVYPVFIPFAGCKTRCVFCSQNLQTGHGSPEYHSLIEQVENDFARIKRKEPVEIAFYGGTFTALPENEQEEYLAMAARLKEKGQVCKVRCSTRPDAITPKLLKNLREQGLNFIELGIQSFCSEPLKASLRSYSGATAYSACQMVQESGMGLGIQLMPGMPQHSPKHFTEDIKICLELKPDAVRMYPCMVIRGTALAARWEHGYYKPWDLESTIEILAPAVLALWERGIKVIRIGLAPESDLLENLLDGPFHPALGQCLRSRALYLFLKKRFHSTTGQSAAAGRCLLAPQRVQGEFFGHKGDLKEAYAALGLSSNNIRWCSGEYFELIDA